MSKLRLHGTSSGYTDIAPTAAAGNNTLTAPTGTGTIVIKDGSGSIGITSVQSTNANFSGTTRITSGISTTLNITTSRINTGIITTFTATNSTFAGDIDPSINGAYDIGASNKKFKQLFINNIDASAGVVTASAVVPTGYEQQLSHRNIWINGDASVAQKGTSIASLSATSGYVNGGPDRTYLNVGNHATWTLAQGTDAPPGFNNCVQMTATTGDGSVAANASARWWQRWEGRDMQRFMKGTSSAKEFALSFWVKSATTGDYAIELLDYDNSNRGVTRTYTVNAADTWEHKKVILPADTTGTFDNDNVASFACEFWLVAGSNYTSGGADASWHAYSDGKRAGGHTANAGASNNDYVRITGIQLEAGSHCTPYEHKSYAEELRACRRYYYRETIANNDFFTGMGMADIDGNTVILNLPLPVVMRQEPTLDTTGTAGDYMIRRSTTQTCTSVPSIGGASTRYQAAVSFTKSSHGWGDGSAVRCGSSGGSYLGFSAEL